MRYFDVFGESGFHSAFMTTYAFSAQAFEDVPLPKLRASGCRNIAVLADKAMLNMSIGEYGAPRYAGALYHVAKVAVGGAFHPKLTILIGAEKGRLLIGSANLTELGLAGNKELVVDIPYSAETREQAAIFGQAINYIKHYVPAEDPWFPNALNQAFRYSPWLRDAAGQDAAPINNNLSLIVDRSNLTILQQIVDSIDDDEIERLVVLSPYWDENLEGLTRLRSALGSPPTDILIDTRVKQFPSVGVAGMSGIRLFDLKDNSSPRFLHAKLILVLGRKSDHVISGSMNCSLPALMGPSIQRGNAEAGIYKRVPRGAALLALGLSNYIDNPLEPSDVPLRANAADRDYVRRVTDGGELELRGHYLHWTPPSSIPARPVELLLFDRDGAEFKDRLSIERAERYYWELAFDEARPRTGQVLFADDSRSCPTIIVDLDALQVRTLPPHRGKRRRISEFLDETSYEDLFLLEAIKELETLDGQNRTTPNLSDRSALDAAVNRAPANETGSLTYAEVVQARDRARIEGRPHALFGGRARESATDLIGACLNRLIGLVSADLSMHDEIDLQRQADLDLRNTGPASLADHEPYTVPPLKRPKPKPPRPRTQETAEKICDAVVAFEERVKSLGDGAVSITEIMRLRTLLQIVLAYAQPAERQAIDSYVLPISGKEKDWPRLLGRLLQLHFRLVGELRFHRNDVDDDDQARVLEYLAIARFAAHSAVEGARAFSTTSPILKPLEGLKLAIDEHVAVVLAWQGLDTEYFRTLNEKLNDRFSSSLHLSVVPSPV